MQRTRLPDAARTDPPAAAEPCQQPARNRHGNTPGRRDCCKLVTLPGRRDGWAVSWVLAWVAVRPQGQHLQQRAIGQHLPDVHRLRPDLQGGGGRGCVGSAAGPAGRLGILGLRGLRNRGSDTPTLVHHLHCITPTRTGKAWVSTHRCDGQQVVKHAAAVVAVQVKEVKVKGAAIDPLTRGSHHLHGRPTQRPCMMKSQVAAPSKCSDHSKPAGGDACARQQSMSHSCGMPGGRCGRRLWLLPCWGCCQPSHHVEGHRLVRVTGGRRAAGIACDGRRRHLHARRQRQPLGVAGHQQVAAAMQADAQVGRQHLLALAQRHAVAELEEAAGRMEG